VKQRVQIQIYERSFPMAILISAKWWSFVVRGLLAIIFGILALIMPGPTLLALVLLFGIYSVADGIFNIMGAFTVEREQTRWWVLLIEGIVSIAAGVIAFVLPGLTALALLYLIAAWAVVTGVLEIAAAIRLRRHIKGEWLLALAGVLSVVFGALIALRPGVGALAIVWWIGAYAIAFGALLIALGLRIRQLVHLVDPGTVPPAGNVVPGH
jgi:uncharacterized membrane protein HdeD (DUF308 family)